MVLDVKNDYFGKFTYGKYKKIRGGADKFNEYFNLINDLYDEDKRDAALYEQGFKLLIKSGEKLLGCSLSNHPVFTLHETHFKVLWEVFGAYNKQKNTRQLMNNAINIVEQVRKSSNRFAKKYRAEYKHVRNRIESKLKGHPHHFHKYVNDLTRSGFKHSSKEDIIEECLFIMRERVPLMWKSISTEVDELKCLTRGALVEYAAIATYCRTIESLVCKYDGKVREMRRSKKSIEFIAGSTLMQERMMDKLNGGRGTKAQRSARQDPGKAAHDAAKVAESCVRRMVWLAEKSKTLHIFGLGIPGGAVFPWDLAARRGIQVPWLRGVQIPAPVRKLIEVWTSSPS